MDIPPEIPPGQPPTIPPKSDKKLFYGTTQLNPVSAKLQFAEIVDEVVEQFTSKLGVNVSISVEIQANASVGFDESLQRGVKENCNQLGFSSAEFEEDD